MIYVRVNVTDGTKKVQHESTSKSILMCSNFHFRGCFVLIVLVPFILCLAADAHQKPPTEKTIIYHACVLTESITRRGTLKHNHKPSHHILNSPVSFTIASSSLLGVFCIAHRCLEAGQRGRISVFFSTTQLWTVTWSVMRLQPCSRLDYHNNQQSPPPRRVALINCLPCLGLQKCPNTTWRAPGASGSRGCGRRGSAEWPEGKVPPPQGRSRIRRAAARRARRWVSEMKLVVMMEWVGSVMPNKAVVVRRKKCCTSESSAHISRLSTVVKACLWWLGLLLPPVSASPALKSWNRAHWGLCRQSQCSNGESQISTKRRRNWR